MSSEHINLRFCRSLSTFVFWSYKLITFSFCKIHGRSILNHSFAEWHLCWLMINWLLNLINRNRLAAKISSLWALFFCLLSALLIFCMKSLYTEEKVNNTFLVLCGHFQNRVWRTQSKNENQSKTLWRPTYMKGDCNVNVTRTALLLETNVMKNENMKPNK